MDYESTLEKTVCVFIAYIKYTLNVFRATTLLNVLKSTLSCLHIFFIFYFLLLHFKASITLSVIIICGLQCFTFITILFRTFTKNVKNQQ